MIWKIFPQSEIRTKKFPYVVFAGLWAAVGIFATAQTLGAEAPLAFSLELGREPKTIGDLRPAFINFNSSVQPRVSIKEVMRRYRVLFQTSNDPKIRVESLWRLNELEAKFGSDKELSVKEENAFYVKALESYELLIAENNPDYPMDALLYQTAKAYDVLGRGEDAVSALRKLASQYPKSRYATEALFRIAEYFFSNGEYKNAELAYIKSMETGREKRFYEKSVFMLGWSKFKQGKQKESLINFLEVLDIAYNTDKSLKELAQGLQQTVDDTLRIMSIIFSFDPAEDPVAELMATSGSRQYVDQLYRSLSEYYYDRQNYQDSVAVNRNFITAYPDHLAAPMVAYRNIEILKEADFINDLWEEKRKFIGQYGHRTDILASAPEHLKVEYSHRVKTVLDELSHFDFIRAGKIAKQADRNPVYLSAAKYYSEYADLFPEDALSGEKRFMAGESFFQAGQYEEASKDYAQSAYDFPPHKQSVEAAYSALISYQKAHQSQLDAPEGYEAIKLAYIDLARKFSQGFPSDTRAKPVILVTMNELIRLNRYQEVVDLTGKVLESGAFKGEPESLRKIWEAKAKSHFNLSDYENSERSFIGLLESKGITAGEKGEAREQLALSIYKKAEKTLENGQWEEAVSDWIRIGTQLPDTSVAKNARYDAASELLKHQQWDRAVPVLVEFRQDYPKDDLTESISEKLIYAYLESGQKLYAADEFEHRANQFSGQEKGRDSLYRAAQLYKDEGKVDAAIRLFEKYAQTYPEPYAEALEARQNLAEHYQHKGLREKELFWLASILDGHEKHGAAAGSRSLVLAAKALLQLSIEKKKKYEQIKLSLPLKQSLGRKKQALKETVESYEKLAQFGVAEINTEVTYSLADIYYRLAKDIMGSDRPAKLDELQSEQYEILLEEQAYPFEEKAIALHELNIQNTGKGIYDKWVRESYAFLAKIEPAKYQRELQGIGSSNVLY